jgi:aminopeptidase N
VTVYNKGAEVIRMIHTLLGAGGFRAGLDLYFERHDGQAVTTEDFVSAMEDATGADLTQFRRWYHQAGTPCISVSESYDESTGKYRLELGQSTPATPGQDTKQPFHIPVKIALMDASGNDLPIQTAMPADRIKLDGNTAILQLVEPKQEFVFSCVDQKPVLSLLRGYSAPVNVSFDRDDEELAFCMAHDSDEFNRWDAGQTLSTRLILSLVDRIQAGQPLALPDYYLEANARVINDHDTDKSLIARALTLPSLSYIGEKMDTIAVDEIHQAREFVLGQLALTFSAELEQIYRDNHQHEYQLNPAAMAERFLRNQALSYLMYNGEQGELLALEQYDQANNMTNQIAAFRALVHHETASSENVISRFYQQWHQDGLVLDKWFMVQATSPHESARQRLVQLFEHEDFDLKNPNRVRSLLGTFCAANPTGFHSKDGFGYRLLGQYIEKLDRINPQIASRLCVPLTRWKRYDPQRQELMRSVLQHLSGLEKLSRDVTEMVEKSLI